MENKLALILKESGYKVTAPRLLVLGFLEASKNPVSVKEIVENLEDKKIDQVTVYRTLQSLSRDGIVNKIDFQEDCAYFELKDKKEDHHHLVCVICKKVTDFTGCQYKKIIKKALKNTPDFATITNHSFEMFGVCKSCTT